MEDKKNNYQRKTFFETYKLPLLVSSIVGLLLNVSDIFNCSLNSTEITIVKPIKDDFIPRELTEQEIIVGLPKW